MPPAAHDVSLALSRIRGAIVPKKEAERATRDIRLGLERIVRVLPEIQEWQGVHVGGTNGKGSICAYLSGLFTLAGIGYGRFVSPAFPEKHNAVTINGQYVSPRIYDIESRHVQNAYQKYLRGWRFVSGENPGTLSPFELETATAFRLFNRLRVPYGIVEVGMGGATDATNAMRRKGVTVISKIDLDHQEYLGNTIEQIAKVKAGIMRPGVPCVVDNTNPSSVIKVLREHAKSIGAPISLSWKAQPFLRTLDNNRWQLEDYQKQNLLCAALAFRHLFPLKEINFDRLLETEPYLPGRMEWVSISELTENQYKTPILVDAAHNLLGVQALARHVDAQVREEDKPVTWIMGLSSSKAKPFSKMIETLIRPQDNVAFIMYGQQDNEPPSAPAALGRQIVSSILSTQDQLYTGEPNIQDALQWATSKAGDGQIVFTGSLYLVRDFYLLNGVQRSREPETQSPGASQLWRLSKLWRQRPLTKDEFGQFKQAKEHWRSATEDSRINMANEEPDEAANSIKSEDGRLPWQPQKGNLDDGRSKNALLGSGHKLPKEIDDELSALYQAATRHEQQMQGYYSAIRSIEDDIDHQSKQDNSDANDDVLAKLRKNIRLLQDRAETHRIAYDEAIEQLLQHPDAGKKFGMQYREIFGRPLKRMLYTPFHARTELDQAAASRNSKQAEESNLSQETTQSEPEESSPKKDFWGRPEDIEKPAASSNRFT
jgi:folylpolyglutamate synthase